MEGITAVGPIKVWTAANVEHVRQAVPLDGLSGLRCRPAVSAM
jgi:hypothetical protein